MDYYIKIRDTQVPVSEEIYKAYCQGARKERYFRESDSKNKTFFYDALDTEELNGCDLFSDPGAESVEDVAERHWLLEMLKKAMSELTEGEQELLCRLYVYEDSLRAYARAKKNSSNHSSGASSEDFKKVEKKIRKIIVHMFDLTDE